MKKLLYILLLIPFALFGQDNYSLSFDGVDDGILVNHSESFENMESLTISFDIKINEYPSNYYSGFGFSSLAVFRIIEKWSGEGASRSFEVDLLNEGILYSGGSTPSNVSACINGGCYNAMDLSLIELNKFNNISLVFDGDSIYSYLNGNHIKSIDIPDFDYITYQEVPMSIGNSTSLGFNSTKDQFNGKLDNVQIWRKALSENEVKSIISCPLSGQEEGLVGFWNFNEGDANTVEDKSSNGNHGVIHGATYSEDVTENNCNTEKIQVPSDYSTIQEAINASKHGDTVFVSSGVYQEKIDFKGKNIVLKGVSPDNTSIVGNFEENPLVTIGSGEDTTSVLSGFTISGGLNGGIRITDASPRLIDLVIENNQDTDGGAIYISNSQNTIITNSIIKDNSSESHGGGIAVFDSSDIEIINCKISNNSSITGGGIYSANSELEISHTVIYENESTNDGGGITISSYSSNGSSLSLSNATLYSNSSINTPQAGGIILAGSNSSASISNSIIWDRVQGSNFELSYTNIQLELNGGVEIASGQGNIDSVALFVDAEEGDFSLQEGSPCIDAGNPESELDPDGTRADIGAFYFHQTFGCTDSLMYNFNDEANTDDGSCITYEEFTIDSLQQALSVFETVSDEEDYSMSFSENDAIFIEPIFDGVQNNFSISAMVKPNGGETWGSIFLSRSHYNDTYLNINNYSSDTSIVQVRFSSSYYQDNNSDNEAQLFGDLDLNQWNNIVGTYNGETIKLYVNGELVDSSPASGEVDWINNCWTSIGGDGNYSASNCSGGYTSMEGNINNLHVWNKPLSQSEIQNYINCPPSGDEEGLVGYWNFNEGSGDTVYDFSGNGNHGIIHGATYSEDVTDSQKGCTDVKALNYDETALCDNGSCVYAGDQYTLLEEENLVLSDSLSTSQQNLTLLEGDASTSLSSMQLALDSWNTTIDLAAGWNMFGYGCPAPIDLVQAMSEHTDNIIILKDNNGKAYMPEFGFNGIGDLTPGLGYQIKVTEAIEGFSLCDWYVNDIPEDNIFSLQDSIVNMHTANCIDDGYCGFDEQTKNCYEADEGYDCGGNEDKEYSLSFDGFNDNVIISEMPNYEGNAHSIMAWVNSTGYGDVMSKDNEFTGQRQWLLEVGRNRNIQAHVWTNSKLYSVISSMTISDNEWCHLAQTWDGETLSLYINGSLVGEVVTNESTLAVADCPVRIGGGAIEGVSQFYIESIIDDAQIWNIALPQNEIQSFMFCSPQGNEEGLVGYWNFNEGDANTAEDKSGNGNHGVIHGATYSEDVPENICE